MWDKDICNEIMHGKIHYIKRSVKNENLSSMREVRARSILGMK